MMIGQRVEGGALDLAECCLGERLLAGSGLGKSEGDEGIARGSAETSVTASCDHDVLFAIEFVGHGGGLGREGR